MQLSSDQTIEIRHQGHYFHITPEYSHINENIVQEFIYSSPCGYLCNNGNKPNTCQTCDALSQVWHIFNNISSTDQLQLIIRKTDHTDNTYWTAQEAAFFCILYRLSNSKCPVFQSLNYSQGHFSYNISSESFLRNTITDIITSFHFKGILPTHYEIKQTILAIKQLFLSITGHIISIAQKNMNKDAFVNALVIITSLLQIELDEIDETIHSLRQLHTNIFNLRQQITQSVI